jgi:hypothetical protein
MLQKLNALHIAQHFCDIPPKQINVLFLIETNLDIVATTNIPLFASMFISHEIALVPHILCDRIPYERRLAQFCSPLFSLRIKPFHFLN